MTLIGTHRLPQLPQTPLKGAPKVGAPAPQQIAAPVVLAQAPPLPPPQLVIPPVMPPLPPTPPANPWSAARNPSANMVQQQYVDLRLEELEAERKPGRKQALDALARILLQQPRYLQHKKIPFKELMRVYTGIERNLQTADLTINFKAGAWFNTENPDDTYGQMYQRAMDGGRMLLQSTDLNDAEDRAAIDNRVTFPSNWHGIQTPQQRGLSPARQGAERIMRQMNTGALSPSALKPGAFEASNPNFNPHTKQIFMGLNYGRRPHGSATSYGKSYFVCNSSLKSRCLYYAGDTFLQKTSANHAGGLQVSFDNLGALLGKTENTYLMQPLLDSCFDGKILRSASADKELIEAHHFGELRFREHVDFMVISPQDVQPRMWPDVVENARKFASKHGIQLYQTN